MSTPKADFQTRFNNRFYLCRTPPEHTPPGFPLDEGDTLISILQPQRDFGRLDGFLAPSMTFSPGFRAYFDHRIPLICG